MEDIIISNYWYWYYCSTRWMNEEKLLKIMSALEYAQCDLWRELKKIREERKRKKERYLSKKEHKEIKKIINWIEKRSLIWDRKIIKNTYKKYEYYFLKN